MSLAVKTKSISSFSRVIFITGLIFLSGCEQSENVTIHEPGVYQGASDDLTTDQAQLQERLKNQMDR